MFRLQDNGHFFFQTIGRFISDKCLLRFIFWIHFPIFIKEKCWEMEFSYYVHNGLPRWFLLLKSIPLVGGKHLPLLRHLSETAVSLACCGNREMVLNYSFLISSGICFETGKCLNYFRLWVTPLSFHWCRYPVKGHLSKIAIALKPNKLERGPGSGRWHALASTLRNRDENKEPGSSLWKGCWEGLHYTFTPVTY